MGDAAIEAEVRRVAGEIARAGAGEDAHVFHLSWWSERMLAHALDHPEFKTQLFRFVDVFPACHSQVEVQEHLEEYFAGVDVPRAVDLGLELAGHTGPVGRAASARVARSNIERMARQFIVGADAEEALENLEPLWRAGEAFTVDVLGEKTVTAAEADAYAAAVGALLENLAAGTSGWPAQPLLEADPWGSLPRVNVSVKPTALAPSKAPLTRDAGLAEVIERLTPILDRARELGATVHLDMEDFEVRDLTHDLLTRIGSDWADGPDLGVVVQAYLRDSYQQLEDLVAWSRSTLARPLQVRLVKGAYWDYETAVAAQRGWPAPVFADKGATDANFERCVDLLVRSAGDVRPAVASHNLRSIAYAAAAARASGLPDDALEFQLLYGMAEPVHVGLRALGRRVRVYAPVGELVPGMAYLVRRLLENTSNESFVRMRFAEGAELDALLQPPRPDQRAREIAERDGRGPYAVEPHAEWRRAPVRAAMGAAVERAPASLPVDAPVVIAGERVGSAHVIASRDPGATERLVARSGCATLDDADRAVAAALEAQPAWAAEPPGARADVLFRAAERMRAARFDLAALEVFEAGKPWAEADADVAEAIDFLEYYGREALRLAEGAPVLEAPGETNRYTYAARGVGAAITPWNFPLAIPTGMVAGPLVMGNAVMFKPAEQTPAVAQRLFEILIGAGVPPTVLAFLPGRGEEVGAHLVEHPDISFVNFTGSKEVGLGIVEAASVTRPGQRHVKRVVAEMGGKNAMVIDADADLDVAVPAVITSAFGFSGQKCSACSRVLVHEAVVDRLVDRLAGAAALLTVGHPADMSTQVGPLIDEDAYRKVAGYQALAAEEGEVVYQREGLPESGWYVGPTVVVAPAGCRVTTEEIFGPLVTVTAVADLDEAIAVANDTEYGLTAGVFSRRPSHIARATAALRAGNVYVNRSITGSLVGRQPFGGVGLSGVGSKAGGPDYLAQFAEPRVVTENTIRQGFAPLES